MSLVTCTIENNKVRLISDTQVTQGSFKKTMLGTKLFITPSAVVGFCGNACFSLLIKEILKTRPFWNGTDSEFLRFIDDIRESANERGMTYTNDDINNLSLVVATKDRALVIHGYTILELNDFDAIGSDAEVAVGLMTAGISDIKTMQHICNLSIYCSPPYEVIELDQETGEIFYDILDEKLAALDSYGSRIDYIEIQDSEYDEGDFNPNPEFHIVVNSTQRQHEDETISTIV